MEIAPVVVAPGLVDMQKGEELGNFIFVDLGNDSFDLAVPATGHPYHNDKLWEAGVFADLRLWLHKAEQRGISFQRKWVPQVSLLPLYIFLELDLRQVR